MTPPAGTPATKHHPPAAKSHTGLLDRARRTQGTSDDAIYSMVAHVLHKRGISGGTFLDVGCGTGNLRTYLEAAPGRYVGVDALRYAGFPAELEFFEADLTAAHLGLPDQSAEVVLAVEVIEHLENPRAFLRELVRLAKPGGWILVTTPNQLSLLSLTTLVCKHRFSAFQDVHYPAHLTALLEVDLQRIALECGLDQVQTGFSQRGRIILTGRHFPRCLSRWFPRALSDTIFLLGQKPPGKTSE